MSAPEKLDTRARLLGYSRWAAIGLAVLAALTLALFSGETALRIAAFMAVIAVVLVVVSLTMNGAVSTKVHLEEVLLDEIDMLRDDVRADITTAARATHRAIAERVAHLHQNLETMKRDVDSRALGESVSIRPGVGAAPPRRAIASAPAGVVHHTETVHVTTHQTYVDPAETERAERFVQRPPTWRPERSDRDDRADWDRAAGVDRRPEERPRAAQGWSAYPDRDEHHHPDRDDRSYEDRDDSSTRRSVPSARQPAREDSWSESRLHDYAAPVADLYDDSSEIDAWRNSRAGSRDDDPADDDRWSAMRSGDRWAEVRTDEHGRELRMGERRTAIRADETGTQMRIVDRWSTVRRENPIPDSSRGYDEDRGYADESPSGGFRTGADSTGETRSERRRREEAEAETAGSVRGDDQWSSAYRAGATSDRSRLALPSSGPESAAGWMRGRDERAEDNRVSESRAARRRSSEISGEVLRPARSAEPVGRGSDKSRDQDRRDPDRHGSDRHGSDRHGSDRHGSDRHGADRHGSDRHGADRHGAERLDAGHLDAGRRDPDGRESAWRGADGSDADRRGEESRWSEPGRRASRGTDRDRAEPRGGARIDEPRIPEPRAGESRAGEPRGGFDGRGAGYRDRPAAPRGADRSPEQRSPEQRGLEQRSLEARSSDPRGSDPRSLDPRGGGPRSLEPRSGAPLRGSDPRRDEQSWSAPRRPDARQPEPRMPESRIPESRKPESRVPDPRSHGRDVPPGREYPPDEDNRWEREPSGGRSAVPPRRVEFDPNDDRWR